jgi:hypothetical protein
VGTVLIAFFSLAILDIGNLMFGSGHEKWRRQ